MDLAWVRYQNEDKRQYVHLLMLGETVDKHVGMLVSGITPIEANRVLIATDALNKMNLPERVNWIKQNVAAAKSGIKTIRKDRSTIVSKHELKKRGQIQASTPSG
jgi:hypothetical protein